MILTTADLLKSNDVHSAIIVDDAYDPTPTAADLAMSRDEWDNFLDDLVDDDVRILQEIYPGFVLGQESTLLLDDHFVAALWGARNRFPSELIVPLFQTYEQDSAHDLRFVQAVERELVAFGVEVTTAGRDFVANAGSADVIVIDLFLGAQQTEADMRISIDGLARVVEERKDRPPIIILMSRSGRLMQEAGTFRDRAKVFASGFRTIVKADIDKPGRLEQLLRELARHRKDSLRLSRFLLSWGEGVAGALRRTEDDIRRLDLDDWAQIYELLLAGEGARAGRYILEVLEFSFLHELESESSFLDAAAQLDSLEREAYPPTTITASKDTLGLVAKTLYEHNNCRVLDVGSVSPVEFGDIIGPIDASEFPSDSIFAQLDGAVLVTMTPACDLQREGVERILFMVGKTSSVDAPATGTALTGLRTPILYLPGERRVWVDWQRNHILTLSTEEVNAVVSQVGCSVGKLARLRTANAVSLQQQLLSNLGRVGLVAPIPSTFPVQVAVYYPSTEGDLVRLSIGGKESIEGVCYIGRQGNKKGGTAPLDASNRGAFLDALVGLCQAAVHDASWNIVSSAREASVVDVLFSRGMRFDPTRFTAQDWKESVEGEERVLGRIVYGRAANRVLDEPRKARRAGLVFEIQDPALESRDC